MKHATGINLNPIDIPIHCRHCGYSVPPGLLVAQVDFDDRDSEFYCMACLRGGIILDVAIAGRRREVCRANG